MSQSPSGTQLAPRRSMGRAMVEGVGIMVVAGGIARLFSLVSAPILTRLVGPSPYGILALIGTVSSLASSVALLGIDLSYARFFFSTDGSKPPAVEGFCWRFALTLGLLLSLASTLGWWALIPSTSTNRGLAFMVGLTTLAAVATVMAQTRRRIQGDYGRIALATLVGSGVGILLSILFVRFWRPDAWSMLAGTLAGSLLTLGVLGLPRIGMLVSKSGLDTKQRKAILGLGFASTVTAPMFWVISSADRWFLGMWTGAAGVGIYAFAASIGLSGMMVISAVTTIWFPEASREFESSGESAPSNIARIWARLAGLHMITWLAVVAAGGDVIRWLADPRFHSGTALVPWMAGGVFFYGMANLANTGLFLKKDLKPTVMWWAIGMVFNVIGNMVGVRFFGALGAGVIACLTFALIAGGMIWSSQARLHLPIPWRESILAALLVLASGFVMQKPWGRVPLMSLLAKFPVGILVSAGVGFLLAPDWLKRGLHIRSFLGGPDR